MVSPSPAPQQPHGQGAYGEVPQAQMSYGQAPQPQAPYGQAPQAQVPYGHVPQMPTLPKRTGSVVSLIIGLVLMFIVSPAVFGLGSVIGATSSLGPAAHEGNLTIPVSNLDEITVDSSGVIVIAADTEMGSVPDACSLRRGDTVVSLTQSQDPSDPFVTFSAFGIDEGIYTVECLPSSASNEFSLTYFAQGEVVAALGFSIVWSFVAASVVGLIGFILTIVGIVMLVNVNKKRRMILRQAGF